MTTKVEKSIDVNVPIGTVYNQWTQFEEFPEFMSGIDEVRQTAQEVTHWKASMLGVTREWEAKILEQVPDERVAWAATEGATNSGIVTFDRIDEANTRVNLVLEFEPEGILENIGDKLGLVGDQAEGDLKRFKKFIESRGSETGAWRGEINDGETQDVTRRERSRDDLVAGGGFAGAGLLVGQGTATNVDAQSTPEGVYDPAGSTNDRFDGGRDDLGTSYVTDSSDAQATSDTIARDDAYTTSDSTINASDATIGATDSSAAQTTDTSATGTQV